MAPLKNGRNGTGSGRDRTCAPVVSEGGRDRTSHLCNAVIAHVPVYAKGTPAHVGSWTRGQAGFSQQSDIVFNQTFPSKGFF